MNNPDVVLANVRQQISTHDCPKCSGPAYCAMTAGKSASACWCMSLPALSQDEDKVDTTCMCRRCLTNEVE